jgi:hypothetical protein
MTNPTPGLRADDRERVARAICAACEEDPDHCGDAQGNAFRWQDYLMVADAAIAALSQQPATSDERSSPSKTIKLGSHGSAFDGPDECRAYTYAEQPTNAKAWSLGMAAAKTSTVGDLIDVGLSLLQQLQAEGFGVFELPKVALTNKEPTHG